MELRVRGGHAVLAGGRNGREADPRNLALGPGLADALHEWARVAAAVQRTGNGQGAEVVSRRGRQLAARVAAAMGVPVSYWDPLTDRALVVSPPERATRAPAERMLRDRPRTGEPAPWGTGLTVAAFIAVFVAVAVLALVSTLVSAAAEWVAVLAAVVVTAGLAPSLWLGRRLPIVRWLALGAAVGVAFSWIGVLVIVFGS